MSSRSSIFLAQPAVTPGRPVPGGRRQRSPGCSESSAAVEILLDQLGGIWEITSGVTVPEVLQSGMKELLNWPFIVLAWSAGGASLLCKQGVRGSSPLSLDPPR